MAKAKRKKYFEIKEKIRECSQKWESGMYSQLYEQYAYLFGCQFIIATHSPFLLAMNDVKIYDLDIRPVKERPWTELENVRILYDLFHRFENKFATKSENRPSDSEMTAMLARANNGYMTVEEAIELEKRKFGTRQKRDDCEFEFSTD